jgi:hypothetical protein
LEWRYGCHVRTSLGEAGDKTHRDSSLHKRWMEAALEGADAPTGDRVAAVLNSRSGGAEMRGWQQDSRAWRQRESRAAAAGVQGGGDGTLGRL